MFSVQSRLTFGLARLAIQSPPVESNWNRFQNKRNSSNYQQMTKRYYLIAEEMKENLEQTDETKCQEISFHRWHKDKSICNTCFNSLGRKRKKIWTDWRVWYCGMLAARLSIPPPHSSTRRLFFSPLRFNDGMRTAGAVWSSFLNLKIRHCRRQKNSIENEWGK